MANIDRRTFVKNSAAATAVSAMMIGPKTWAGANDKVRVACVGVRSRGFNHIEGFQALPGVKVEALCDVDDKVLENSLQKFEEKGWWRPLSQFYQCCEDPRS